MDAKEQHGHDRITTRVDKYDAGKKNKGGAAYNILNLDYDKNKDGVKLLGVDNDAKVRGLIRSKNLDKKNNCGFNILTGENRAMIAVPQHQRYNPIQSAGN